MGYNTITIVGWIDDSPHKRESKNGNFYSKFTLKEGLNWHDVMAFGELHETVDTWIDKGDKVLLEGSLDAYIYYGDDGYKHQSYSIMAEEIRFLYLTSEKSQRALKEHQKKQKEEKTEQELANTDFIQDNHTDHSVQTYEVGGVEMVEPDY